MIRIIDLDLWTCRSRRRLLWTCRSRLLWTSGRRLLWTSCGRVDVDSCGRVDVDSCGRVDVDSCGHLDVDSSGHVDVDTCGRRLLWTPRCGVDRCGCPDGENRPSLDGGDILLGEVMGRWGLDTELLDVEACGSSWFRDLSQANLFARAILAHAALRNLAWIAYVTDQGVDGELGQR